MSKNVIIIYGFDINQHLSSELDIILIEPRKNYIDSFNSHRQNNLFKYRNVTLVTKLLNNCDRLTEITLYNYKNSDEYNSQYSLTIDDFQYNNSYEKFYIKKEKVQSTSIYNIIREYNIDKIDEFYININISNVNRLFADTENIINKFRSLYVNNSCFYFDMKKIKYFDKFKFYDNINDYAVYHNTLSSKSPKTLLFFVQNYYNLNTNKEFDRFVDQHNIHLLNKKNDIVNKQNNYIYEQAHTELEKIFKREEKYDVLIQISPKYLQNFKPFDLKYPLEDKYLYIDVKFDLVYGNKNTMYYYYELLCSEDFLEYMENIKSKTKVFSIFHKKYLYEYLSKSKIFNINIIHI